MVHIPRRMIVFSLLCGTLGVAQAPAQDVAEAARQERERKAQQKEAHHVYTEEDLKQSKIATSQDEALAIAHKAAPPAPRKKETEPQVAEQNPETESLGDVARRYRQEKAARQAEQAAQSARNKAQSNYPLEIPKATLAAPKPLAAPDSGSLRNDELAPERRPSLHLPVGSSRSRISPFEPRGAVAPAVPQANVPLVLLASSVQRQKVERGDSWWKLASRYLGKGSRWEELLRVNPGISRDPRRLPAGTMVFVPGTGRLRSVPSEPQIVVQSGDTLWSLAREHLGCGSRWTELAAANPEVTDFKKLQIGTKLKLAERAGRACLTHQVIAPRD